MNISKEDAVAHLSKWRDAGAQVRAQYSSVTGTSTITGGIMELSSAGIKIAGKDSEMNLYFRNTSTYEYKDARQEPTQANKNRPNQYPTVIDVTFSNGDRLEVRESFAE